MKRGKNKKGQVTLFIIIAIVIVAFALIAVVLWPRISALFMSKAQAEAFLSSQAEPLRDSVYDCVKATSLEIFEKIGLQAGYYTTEHLYAIDFADPKYVVMYKDANKIRINKLPSLSAIALEYENALEKDGYGKIDKCLNNFESFKRVMDVEPSTRKITTEIRNEDILIKVDWPITIKKGQASKILAQKDVRLLIPLGNVWHVANDIVNSEVQQTNFEGIVWDKYIIANSFLLKYVKFESRALNENQIAFLIESVPYRAGEETYLFYFAINRS